MSLIRLNVTDFRNLAAAKLHPIATGFNFLYGNNGSGKTSLLEAIYYLSRGRSFRSSAVTRIINHAATQFSLHAQILATNQQAISVGVERQRTGRARIRLAGQEAASLIELAQHTPVLLMNSNCYNLLESGPIFRRKYLDWGAFYLIPTFLTAWKQYERALKQRNAALQQRANKAELIIWSDELIKTALELDQLRTHFTEQLLPVLQQILSELLTVPELKIEYYPGWEKGLPFAEAIAASFDKDRYVGHTHTGPHRADLSMTVKHIPLKDILSRGQQKLFVCAMIVAQGALLQQAIQRKPIYLIDDLPAELDSISRAHLMKLLSQQSVQVFLTAVEQEILADAFVSVPAKMFHVEHGEIKEVN